MRIAKTALMVVLSGVLVLAGCGGNDDDVAEAPEEVADDITDETPENSDDDDDGGELPDPCTVIPGEDLAALLGSEPGEGTVNAVVPEQRKVCIYSSGLILSIEIADNYEASVELIRENSGGGTVEDVTDVGSAAVWQDLGGVGQLVAQGDDYFVGVSLAGGKDVGQAIAEAMLAAL